MLGERQVAAPLMAQRAAHGALRPAHRRFQPGEGVGVQLAGLRLSGKPQPPSQCQFGHETLVLGFALIAPAPSRPGQHCAVRRQRGRQVAPCGHASTVGQRFPQLVLRDDQQEQRRTSSPALAERTRVRTRVHHQAGRPIEPRNLAAPSGASATTNKIRLSKVPRHKVGSLLNDLGVPARDAQTILGHTRISATLEICADTHQAARRDALTRLHGLHGEARD